MAGYDDALAALQRVADARAEADAALATVLPDLVGRREDHRANRLLALAHANRWLLRELGEHAGLSHNAVRVRIIQADDPAPYVVADADADRLRRLWHAARSDRRKGPQARAATAFLAKLSKAGARDADLGRILGLRPSTIAMRLGRYGYRDLPLSARRDSAGVA